MSKIPWLWSGPNKASLVVTATPSLDIEAITRHASVSGPNEATIWKIVDGLTTLEATIEYLMLNTMLEILDKTMAANMRFFMINFQCPFFTGCCFWDFSETELQLSTQHAPIVAAERRIYTVCTSEDDDGEAIKERKLKNFSTF